MNKTVGVLLGLGAVLLAVLFTLLKPDAAPVQSGPAAVAAVVSTPQELRIDLVVQDGRRVSGPELIQAMQAQPIRLRVTSNRADELHLHGYDLRLKLQPGVAAGLSFNATLSGRFEYELHHAHAALGVLEVQPRTL